VVESTPEAKPVEVHEPVTTSPEIEAGNVWQQLLASIPVHPATGMPAPHKMRLASSALIEDTGDKLVVSLENQMHFEWFNDDIKRTKFLQDLLPKLGREGASIEFVLKKKTESIVIESEAVELPVDGPRLERIVREVFNVPVSPGEGEEQI
jgi:hypothetical protein